MPFRQVLHGLARATLVVLRSLLGAGHADIVFWKLALAIGGRDRVCCMQFLVTALSRTLGELSLPAVHPSLLRFSWN